MVAARCEDSRPDYNPRKHGMQLHERGRRGVHPLFEEHHGLVDCAVHPEAAGHFLRGNGESGTDEPLRADFQRQRPAFQRAGGHGGGNSRCALSRPGNRRRPHPQRVRLSGAQLRRSDSRTGTPDGSDVGEAVHRRRRREECAAERADRAVHRQGSRRPAN